MDNREPRFKMPGEARCISLLSSGVATLALLSAACGLLVSSAALAEDAVNSYDGSEFHGTSFRDTELDRQDFRDLKTKDRRSEKGYDIRHGKKWSASVHPGEEHDRRESKDVAGVRRSFEEEKRFAPVHELAGDWVPSPIDVKNAGVFSIEPFNGTPVPYNLNGHVDTESGGEYRQFESMSGAQ